MTDPVSPVGSVDRALRILQIIGEHPRGITLNEMSRLLGVPKSSLHRLLAALRYRGFATQHEATGPYFLGTELLATAFRFYDALDLRTLIQPLLKNIVAELNETTHMAVLDGAHVVYQDKIETTRTIRLTSMVGGRNPAHATGVGKALLAWTYTTDDALHEWISQHGPLVARTRKTLTSESQLSAELHRIRERGYALDLEENEYGVHCVGVPVFVGKDIPAAAISVTTPKDRMPVTRQKQIAATVRRILDDEAGMGRPNPTADPSPQATTK